MTRTIDARRTGRTGFTLIELLIVIAIIVILIALTAGAAMRFMASQYVANTQTLLQRMDSRLQKQISSIIDKARAETIPTSSNFGYPAAGRDALSLSNNSNDRARVINIKFRMQQYFPTTFSEALFPTCGYPASPGYVKFLSQFGITSSNVSNTSLAQKPTNLNFSHESAVCLYMILKFGPDTTGEDDLGLNSATKQIIDPRTNTGIPALVDAWGNPFYFCRWPVGHALNFISPVNPLGMQQVRNTNNTFQDPTDPKGLLNTMSWLNSPAGATFQTISHPLPPRKNRTIVAYSVNLAPVIVSAGPDGQLGLYYDPNGQYPAPYGGYPGYPLWEITPGATSSANDNLYSR